MRTSISAVVSSLSALALCTLLAGCSSNFGASTGVASTPTQVGLMKGKVYGGQQPVVGAAVSLYAASTTAYGGASTSLLTTAVKTDSGGGFSLTGDYVCVPGTQVYVYAKGGNAGAGTNAVLGFMAVLGQCPSTGTLATEVPFVIVNEATTVAAAYALAGFAVDATHVGSSGTALAQIGIANAFATAGNLVSVATADQGALVTTPGGNGTVPQAEVNTLADILAACVNSTGATSTPCKTLLADALSAGTTGTAPADTATAAINIAHNPTANIAALYALATATAPFQPTLTAVPNDWTVQIGYSGGGYVAAYYFGSHTLAVDGVGNIWYANYVNDVVSEFNPLGVPVAVNGYTSPGIDGPISIAIDETGSVWVTDFGETPPAATISKFTAGGVPVGDYSAGLGLDGPDDLQFDGSGNGFIANGVDNNIVKISTTGALLKTGTTVEDLDFPEAVALEPGTAGGVWAANGANQYASFLTNALAGTLGKSLGGKDIESSGISVDATGNAWVPTANLTTPAAGELAKITTAGVVTAYKPGLAQVYVPLYNGITIDGGGNVFTTDLDNAVIYETSSAGTTISGLYGFAPPGNSGYGSTATEAVTVAPNSVVSDGSGNIWYSTIPESMTSADDMLYEVVGAAVPVITPLAVAVAESKIATKP